MADLSPNLAPYGAIAAQGQANQLSLPQLLQITGAARSLQNQAAIGKAIQQNPDDPSAALKSAISSSPYLGPEDITSFTHAQEAQSRLQQFYAGEATKTAGMLWAKAISPQGADHTDWDRFKPILRGYGVPASVLSTVESKLIRSDGRIDPDAAAEFRQWVGGPAEPQQGGMTERGRGVSFPQAAAAFGGVAGGPGAGRGVTTTNAPAGAMVGNISGQDLGQDLQAARNYPNQTNPLRMAIGELTRLGPQGTGEGSGFVNQVKNFLNYSGAAKSLGIDVDKTTTYETAKKNMIRWADSVSAGGTNDRLAAAISGNPNMSMQQATALTVAKISLALRRMQQGGLMAFQKAQAADPSLKDENYADFYSKWASDKDERAYGYDLMNKPEREAMFKTGNAGKPMSKEQFQRFEKTYNEAKTFPNVLNGAM